MTFNKTGLTSCPFCGETPDLPDGGGTQYEIICDCGMAGSSVQIADLMSIEERRLDGFKDWRYGEEYIKRAESEAVKDWNTRVESEGPLVVALKDRNAELEQEVLKLKEIVEGLNRPHKSERLMATFNYRLRRALNHWFFEDAYWWQFWMPQSGWWGGALASIFFVASIVFLTGSPAA